MQQVMLQEFLEEEGEESQRKDKVISLFTEHISEML